MDHTFLKALLVVPLIVSGCVTHSIVVTSSPSAATVRDTTTGLEQFTPATIYATFSSYPKKENGCVDIQTLSVTWVSGAQRNIKPEICENRSAVIVNVIRPKGYPRISMDYELAAFAASQRAEAQAAANAASLKALEDVAFNLGQALAGGSTSPQPVRVRPFETRCRQVGSEMRCRSY